jgi:hypothetical protein
MQEGTGDIASPFPSDHDLLAVWKDADLRVREL